MKTVKSLLLLAVFLMSANLIKSQNVVPGSEALLAKLRLNESIRGIEHTSYSKIIGDPYLFGDFCQGQVVFKSGEVYNVDIRYDIYADLVHIRYEDNMFAIAHPEKLNRIIADTLTLINDYISRSGGKDVQKNSSYFILTIDGKCKVLIKKNIRIQDPEPPKILQDAKPARFIHTKDTYYLKLNESNAVLINNKSDILDLLNDQKEALIDFMNAEKIRVNQIEDIIHLVNFYNSL